MMVYSNISRIIVKLQRFLNLLMRESMFVPIVLSIFGNTQVESLPVKNGMKYDIVINPVQNE